MRCVCAMRPAARLLLLDTPIQKPLYKHGAKAKAAGSVTSNALRNFRAESLEERHRHLPLIADHRGEQLSVDLRKLTAFRKSRQWARGQNVLQLHTLAKHLLQQLSFRGATQASRVHVEHRRCRDVGIQHVPMVEMPTHWPRPGSTRVRDIASGKWHPLRQCAGGQFDCEGMPSAIQLNASCEARVTLDGHVHHEPACSGAQIEE